MWSARCPPPPTHTHPNPYILDPVPGIGLEKVKNSTPQHTGVSLEILTMDIYYILLFARKRCDVVHVIMRVLEMF
jgi:hypothetical protein